MTPMDKKLLRTLRLLFAAPFIAGFIAGMIVFTEPEGMMLIGLGGMIGIWMIAATASYMAIKNYMIPPEK
ncbi:MAG: hypothetical protein R3302_04940 [Sulfurimonadaceae bacterium]|nr:hypothetical protein [Sulfurimonadaceae bacterium]